MKPTDQRLRDALRFFLLPAGERVQFAKAFARDQPRDAPPWIDPEVRHELAARKYTSFKPLPDGQEKQAGDITAVAADGKIWTGEITALGRAWFEMGKN